MACRRREAPASLWICIGVAGPTSTPTTPPQTFKGDAMMKSVGTKAGLLASAAMLSLMAAGAAQAQSVAQDHVATVDDIIVTAQLRAQDPIEVPFALTAYSGQFLEN